MIRRQLSIINLIICQAPWGTTWAKSCGVISYTSGPDDAILSARDHPLSPSRKSVLCSYDKSFTDQACSVKMARYWPRSFLRFYGPRLRLGPWTRKGNNETNIPPSWRTCLINNPYTMERRNFSWWRLVAWFSWLSIFQLILTNDKLIMSNVLMFN